MPYILRIFDLTKKNKMRKNLILLTALLSLSAIGCKTAKTPVTMEEQTQEVSNDKHLEGNWTLHSLSHTYSEEKSLHELFPGKTPSLNFNTQERTLNGNDGCNGIFGSYQVSGTNGLKIGENLASTMMACNGVADYTFKKALNQVTNFKIEDQKLVLYSGDTKVMTFEKQPEVAQVVNLDGTKWKLSFIQPLDRSLLSVADRFPMGLPTLNFQENSINGNTGCNTFNGEFQVKDSQIAFDRLAMTRKFCDGVQENLFTENLNSTTHYKVENQELILLNQDNMVVLRFTKN